jgi:hypothetical protein
MPDLERSNIFMDDQNGKQDGIFDTSEILGDGPKFNKLDLSKLKVVEASAKKLSVKKKKKSTTASKPAPAAPAKTFA